MIIIKDVEKAKKLLMAALQEVYDEQMEKQIIWVSIFTFLPILVFVFTPKLFDRFFAPLSGNFMYVSSSHYFSFSQSFLLDLPYFLPPIIWALALCFSCKARRRILSRVSFLNYLILALTVLNSVFWLYSVWFIFGSF